MSVGTRIPQGDELWRTLNKRLTVFVGRRIGDPHAAEDVAQEVLLRLHSHLGELRADDRLVAFAYRIARNAIIDHYRSSARSKELPSAHDDIVERIDADRDAGEDAHAGALELARCLAPLVRRLPDQYREALTLTDLGELTQTQAALVAGISVPGMKARVQRGRAQLHALLTRCCDVAFDEQRHITGVQRSGTCGCAPG